MTITSRTAAGRWMLAHVKPDYTPPESGKTFTEHVAAIEAEANSSKSWHGDECIGIYCGNPEHGWPQ